MTVTELFNFISGVRPGFAFTNEQLMVWLNEIEGKVQTDIMLLDPAVDEDQTGLVEYNVTDDMNTELIVPFPWNKLYRYFLLMSIDLYNGEYQRYANSYELFNEAYEEYAAWYAQNIAPANGLAVAHGYYLTAYQFAVRGGYTGTEEEFYEDLAIVGDATEIATSAAASAEQDASSIRESMLKDVLYGETAVSTTHATENTPVEYMTVVIKPKSVSAGSFYKLVGSTGITVKRYGESESDRLQTYTAEFPDEAFPEDEENRYVFGGVYDAVSQTLRITHKLVIYDGSESWGRGGNSAENSFFYVSAPADSVGISSLGTRSDGYCNEGYTLYNLLSASEFTSKDKAVAYNNSSMSAQNKRVYVRINALADATAAQFKNYLSGTGDYAAQGPRPIYLAYRLNEEVPVPCEQPPFDITTISGKCVITTDDNNLTEGITVKCSVKPGTKPAYVTPEQYGAIGDGVADDTDALQAAINSRRDVYLSPSRTYLVTRTLTIADKTYRGRCIFSNNQDWRGDTAHIKCYFPYDSSKSAEENKASRVLFNIMEDGVTFKGITINGDNLYNVAYTITIFKLRRPEKENEVTHRVYPPADVDFWFVDSHIIDGGLGFDISGRGFRVMDNLFYGLNGLVRINWEGESSITYHNNESGQRAFIIMNNRFHSMGATPIITVAYSYARPEQNPQPEPLNVTVHGLQFCNNHFDRGNSPLVSVTDDYSHVTDWMISNNVFVGMIGDTVSSVKNLAFMRFKGSVRQMTFSNNTFRNYAFTGSSPQYITDICKIEGDAENLVINGNNIQKFYCRDASHPGHILSIDGDLSYSAISNNVVGIVDNLSASSALVESGGNITSASLIGNVVGALTGATGNVAYRSLIHNNDGEDTKDISNVRLFGNVSQANGTESALASYTITDTPNVTMLISDSDLYTSVSALDTRVSALEG